MSDHSAPSHVRRTAGPRRWARRLAVAIALPIAIGVVPWSPSPADADDWLYRPASGVFTVRGHGEGHGRGMSQYGAQGAALQGRTYDQILDFYYPGTTNTVLDPGRPLRVWVSADTDNTTDVVPSAGLSITDGNGNTAAVPAGADLVRTVVNGTGFIIQARTSGFWGDISPSVPGPVRFRTSDLVEVVVPGGTRFGYRGYVQAVRRDGGSITVNVTRLDDYVSGVVPRESIGSWQPAALESQAIAARTYASVRFTAPLADQYDICDTGACQVYGGASRNGVAQEQAGTNRAVSGTSGLIRTYNSAPINAQFGSTNGGWTVDGGVPYLVARPDPYEAAANPPQSYANWSGTLSAASLESGFPAIGSFTRLRITRRDGNGDWGGRVLAATVEGTRGSVDISGDKLRLALTANVRSAYFQVFDPDVAGLPVGSLDGATVDGTILRASGWALDPDQPTAPLEVHLYDYGPDGRVSAIRLTADGARPDVGRAYAGVGDRHGFTATTGISGRGRHTICAFGINVGSGSSNPRVGCVDVVVGNPFGSLDTVVASPGALRLTGWSVDPDAPAAATGIDVYDAGPAGTRGFGGATAAGDRPDVAGVYPLAGAGHGFGVTVPITEAGNHRVCAYAIAVKPGGVNPAVGCRDVRFADPFGSLDAAAVSGGAFTVSGWALDPVDVGRTVEVHVYVTSPAGTVGYSGIAANGSRPDVGQAFGAGDAHGFRFAVPDVPNGPATACAFAIAAGANVANRLLGCTAVTRG